MVKPQDFIHRLKSQNYKLNKYNNVKSSTKEDSFDLIFVTPQDFIHRFKCLSGKLFLVRRKAIFKTLASGCTYIQTFECARLVYSHVAKPRTHVFNVELRNVGKNFPLFSTDFIFGQILKTISYNGGLNVIKTGTILRGFVVVRF